MDDGCVSIVADGVRWLPVFPASKVQWDGSTLTYNGRAYQSGDVMELGGAGAAGIATIPPAYQIPGSCPTGNLWAVNSLL